MLSHVLNDNNIKYIQKPVENEQLVQIVNETLGLQAIVESFAPLVRIREILRRELLLPDKTPTGITIAGGQEHNDNGDLKKTQQVREEESELEKKIESLLLALLVFCFKHNLPIKDFVDEIRDLGHRANRIGIPLENLSSYAKRLEDTVHSLEEEIKQKRLEKEEALEDYDVTLELLEEYDANRPLFETNKKLREELADTRQERDFYKRQLESERANDLAAEYNNCGVPENQNPTLISSIEDTIS